MMKILLLVFAALFTASTAGAQQVDERRLSSSSVTGQRPPPVVVAAVPSGVRPGPAYWELITGYEGDTDGFGYGFVGPGYVRPIRPGLSWTARAFASYLSYRFNGLDGATSVRSPGVSSAVGLQFGDKSFFRVLAGPELKFRRTAITGPGGVAATRNDTRLGTNLGGEMYANPTPHNNLHGILNYNTSDSYTWSRLGFKQQISNPTWERPNTAFLGVEGIAQGNRDIRSRQMGGFFEVNHVPARLSVVFRAGYKRSTFNVGPERTGPYFSVGLYRRLN